MCFMDLEKATIMSLEVKVRVLRDMGSEGGCCKPTGPCVTKERVGCSFSEQSQTLVTILFETFMDKVDLKEGFWLGNVRIPSLLFADVVLLTPSALGP